PRSAPSAPWPHPPSRPPGPAEDPARSAGTRRRPSPPPATPRSGRHHARPPPRPAHPHPHHADATPTPTHYCDDPTPRTTPTDRRTPPRPHPDPEPPHPRTRPASKRPRDGQGGSIGASLLVLEHPPTQRRRPHVGPGLIDVGQA